jgi:hypothetical protein
MPSYQFSAPSIYRQRLPPTPPEDRMPNYTNTTMGNMPYQHNTYQDPMAHRRQDDRGFDYSGRFNHVNQQHQTMPPAMMYPQPSYYNPGAAVPPNASSNTAFYRPMLGPILPPIRGYEPSHHVDQSRSHGQPLRERQDPRPQEKREEKPVGGVSATLDYEMEVMTDFVTETSQAMYAFLKNPVICLADIDIAGSISLNGPTPPGFRKWVHQVLSATRLPSSTIVLAFDYLSEHMRNIQSPHAAEAGEMELQRLLTTALILGSKFLDDNTFINKSWAEVSGIEVEILNYMEREWLKEISFGLHRDPNTPHGFESFRARWKHFEMTRSSQNMHSKQAAINSNAGQVWMPRHLCSPPNTGDFSPRGIYGNNGPATSYPTPAFSNYVPYGSRSTNTSPPSAPYTSPTTPEYHGHQTAWGSLNGNLNYRMPVTSYQTSQTLPAVSRPATHAPPFMPMAFPAAPVYASGHGPECFCVQCNRQYMMVPHFGLPQSVAG